MRWNVFFLTSLFAVICGCQKPAKEMETSPNTYPPQPELFAVDPAADPAVDGPPGTVSRAAPKTNVPAAASATSRTHQVAKGDTLYSIAKRYYNDGRRWKEIYEANRDQLPTPESPLRVGQVLRIP
ncbi:MAG: LysM peptidoglycan-binding domain-containing protein [Planctomycetota bacterium]